MENKNRKAQTTIFIILAIVIIVAIIGFFIVRNVINSNSSTSSVEVFDFFDSCIEDKTRTALSIAGSQGGYIENPDFEPGSIYAPFSSQLDFLGIGVPYWYYVSSNGLVKEQVPSRAIMENQIEVFLNDELHNCDFNSFRTMGYEINMGDIVSDVKILNNEVRVNVRMDLSYKKADKISRKVNHDVKVVSDFGNLYNLAREIYDKEKNEAFLELYTQDVLYNYAPVTGSEISCSPLIWNAQEVSDDLKKGLEANIQALKIDNGKFELQKETSDYFVVDIKGNENVRFLYDADWPSRVEIWPAENSLLVAEPVGLEEGLGVLGFCFVPYHFVYDVYHPVLIQIYNNEEIFQFPVAVVIDKSVPRDSISGEEPVESNSLDNFCDNANTAVSVNTFDYSLNPIEADISFECFNEVCNIGKTKFSSGEAVLNTDVPQCVNGILTAKSEGYVSGKQIVSTNERTNSNIILNKLYSLPVSLSLGGIPLESRNNEGIAIVNFISEDYSTTLIYPEQRTINLAEGLYNVSVQVFSGSSLVVPATTKNECVQVPKKGLLGFFGSTSEECFSIEIPQQTLTNALSGGGNNVELILESDLRFANGVKIDVSLLPTPNSLEQLQQNYVLIDGQSVSVNLT